MILHQSCYGPMNFGRAITKNHKSSSYQHMLYIYIHIFTSIYHLLLLHGYFAEEDCLVLSQPGDSDLLRGCLCTTRVRNGRMESRSKKMPRIMESRLKMRVMTRQRRNWLILSAPSASSIQIARILAASYQTGQPAKSTNSEIELNSLYIDKYIQFTFAPPSSSHRMNVLRSRSPRVFGGTFSWTAKWTSHKPWWNASQRIIVVPLAFKGFVEIFGRWTATMTDTRTRTALREDFSNSGPSCACFSLW